MASKTRLNDTPMAAGEGLLWRTLQITLGLVGVAMIAALLFKPELGLHAFWNVLIPVAPALLVVSTGLWRNICPLGSLAGCCSLERRAPE